MCIRDRYKRDVYKYTLTVPKDTTEVSFRPESFNRYNNAAIRVGDKSYRYGDAIPVSEGTQIKITSTPTSFMSLLGLKDRVTYTITVKSLEEPEKTPVGTVTVSVQDMICLLYTSAFDGERQCRRSGKRVRCRGERLPCETLCV